MRYPEIIKLIAALTLSISLLSGCAETAGEVNENPRGLAAIPFLARRDVVFFDKAVDVAAAAKPGVPIKWKNPHTGTTGVMTRFKDVKISIFLLCRELRSNVTTKRARTAEQIIVCTDDYGPWYIHSSQILENRPVS